MFGIIIYAEQPTIVTSGIQASLSLTDDINPCTLCTDQEVLQALLKSDQFQIMFVILKDVSDSESQYVLMKHIRTQFYRMRIIALAPRATKDMVFQTIKCGASGFLSADATVQELKEAVYTIRAGHEYFSSSITSLLVSNYVEVMRSAEPTDQISGTEMLGKRELEVLSLWGEGHTNIEIADRLFISVRTVESHKNHIMQKLGIRTTVDLLKFAIRNNIVSI